MKIRYAILIWILMFGIGIVLAPIGSAIIWPPVRPEYISWRVMAL